VKSLVEVFVRRATRVVCWTILHRDYRRLAFPAIWVRSMPHAAQRTMERQVVQLVMNAAARRLMTIAWLAIQSPTS
jgi:hypothetical protein